MGGDEETLAFSIKREFGIVTGGTRAQWRSRKIRNNWIVDKALLRFGR